MQYCHITQGIFRSRPNRFLALVELDHGLETVHVKNTGRLGELLLPGTVVYLEESSNPNRKTRYDLIAVKHRDQIVNIDSQIPNALAAEWIAQGNLFPAGVTIQREKTYGSSRFDLYIESENQKAFLEVKGVTLNKNGTACFPDAPTKRGVKHTQELCRCLQDGYESYLLFVIQMKGVFRFCPNKTTHPAFAEALRLAAQCGVHILAFDCLVSPDQITIDQPVPVCLDP